MFVFPGIYQLRLPVDCKFFTFKCSVTVTIKKESYFIVNEILYKQTDGVSMVSPLGPTLANAFLCFYEKKWLEQCPDKFKPTFYRRHLGDIFVLFKSRDQFIQFRDYLNKCHPNMKFVF